MPDSSINIDLSTLQLDSTTLRALERLLNDIESLINTKPQDATTFLYNLKNQIVKLKTQKSMSDNKIIHASIHELERAFKTHWKVFQAQAQTSHTFYLIIFYAVECGLKKIWLRRINRKGTDELEEKYDKMIKMHGHDLALWVKELRLPGEIIGQYPQYDKISRFHILKDNSIHDMKKAHQAWRYGIKIKPEDESNLVAWLQQICEWIETNLHQR